MTGQVESLHATHHLKHEAGAHVLDYARSLIWEHCHRRPKANNNMGRPLFHQQEVVLPHTNKCCKSVWDIPLLPPLTTVLMSDVHQDVMREWARDNGKSVRQRTVRQETTKYKSGTLPLNMYQSEEQTGEKVKFDGAGEYSSQSSSSDSDVDEELP